MKRHFRYLLTLTALAATLALHGDALAGKGFSFGGGGGNFSGAMRSHVGSSHMARSPSGGMQFKSSAQHTLRGPAIGNLQPQAIQRHRAPLGQAVNRTIPNVPANLLQGNVRNNLLGNGSGATPKLGINVGGQKGPGHAGGITNIGGGHVGGNVARQVAGQVAGQIGGAQANFHAGHIKGKADCRHVIDMLVRHCIGNQTYDPCIKRHCPDPRWAQVGWIPAPPPMAPIGFGLPMPGDLELLSVGMLSDATPEQGPLYQVTLKNVGTIDAEHFRVSIVVVLGEIAEDSPSVTINVDRIAAGETATLQIQMPVTVMALGAQGEQAAPFDTMVVAIDSFDELQESNELNNVATLKRTEVQLVQVGVAATAEEAPAAAAQPAPAQGETPAPEAAPETAPAPQGNSAPPATEEIDIDNLEIDNAEEATELFTR